MLDDIDISQNVDIKAYKSRFSTFYKYKGGIHHWEDTESIALAKMELQGVYDRSWKEERCSTEYFIEDRIKNKLITFIPKR